MAEGRTTPFGEQLRRLREAAGITQEELAERAGLSRDAIGALERGHRRHPQPQTVRALADALSLSERETAALRSAAPKRPARVPASTTEERSSRLPVPLTRLIGRQRELSTVQHMLTSGHARLVTLTGPGGVGKTRLALELAAALREAHPGGVVFVPLASVSDPARVVPAIAEALGVPEGSDGSVVDHIGQNLGEQRLLLILDNFEHVLAAAPEVSSLLAACAGLAVLATSRATLRLIGEQEYPVLPLTIPRPTEWAGLPGLGANDAVALFVERAQAANPAFALTTQNAAAVAAICWRLGGLPLALELAAAQARFLAPSELLARLDQALQSEGAGDLPARQRTLRATLDWSHDLLAEPQRAVLRRLAVFVGGFTLEAAEAVVPGQGVRADDVLRLLGALVAQSLLTVSHDAQGTRYGMLEPIRQYALERLEESGETAQTRRQFAAYFLEFAERAAPELEGRSDQVVWLGRLERELDNLRAVLTWSGQASNGAEVELRLATALWRFWEVRWHVAEGSRWLAGALARSADLPQVLQAKALNAAGNLARDQADHERATMYHERCLEIWRELGDKPGIARSLNNLGVIARDRGDAELTTRLCQESLELFRALGDQHRAAIALISLGMAAGQQGDLERARAHYGESLAWFRAAGDGWHAGWVLSYQADLLARHGATEEARSAAEQGLTLHRATNDSWGVALALSILAKIAQADNDLVTAAERFVEGFRLLTEAGVTRVVPGYVEHLAGVALASGQPDRAARLGGASEALRARFGVARTAGDWTAGAVDLSELRTGPQAAAWAEGRALPLDAVLAEAEALAAEIALASAGQPFGSTVVAVEKSPSA